MILCIDTISAAAGVTLVKEGSALYRAIEPMRASESLLETIDQVLSGADAKPADLKGVLVIKGPGSFTGLRVGIAVANQFAHQLRIPILGLRAEEWWLARSEQKAAYFQSLNRAEVYAGSLGILPLEKLTPGPWLGQLNEEHRRKLSADFKEITDLKSVEDTWVQVVVAADFKAGTTYDLVEPFYGKEAKITRSKHV